MSSGGIPAVGHFHLGPTGFVLPASTNLTSDLRLRRLVNFYWLEASLEIAILDFLGLNGTEGEQKHASSFQDDLRTELVTAVFHNMRWLQMRSEGATKYFYVELKTELFCVLEALLWGF